MNHFNFLKNAGNICELPASDENDHVMCTGYFKNWFHNTKTRQCEEFTYGGCGGTANRFETRAECEKACKKQ